MDALSHPRDETPVAGSVTLVEDDWHIALMLQYNLEALGYSVDLIEHGHGAVERLTCTRPDVIILDWSLPGLSGIEILRQIRCSPLLCTTPVVMLTARCSPEDRARAISTGADAFVDKPFAISTLLATLQKCSTRRPTQQLEDAQHASRGRIGPRPPVKR